MLRRDGLLRFTLSDLVGFGGYQGDEFDAAVNEQISGISRERDAGFGVVCSEDFCDDLLHSCCEDGMLVSYRSGYQRCSWRWSSASSAEMLTFWQGEVVIAWILVSHDGYLEEVYD